MSAITESIKVDTGQYNQIVDAYSTLYPPDGQAPDHYPLAAIESHQVYLAVTDPSINVRGKRVLDLACGNGCYASKLLDWGALSVTGVDVSTGMLEAGRESAEARGIDESRLKFVHGDATDENLLIDGAPFDLVTGCWLLNYMPDAATMTKMYKFVSLNLRPGGYWVGLTTPPLVSGEDYEAEFLNGTLMTQGVWGRHGQCGTVLKALPDGDAYLVRHELGTKAHTAKATFECYFHRKKLMEKACNDSRAFESPEWRKFVIPGQVKDGHDKDHWSDLCLRPCCIVVTARKFF